jgi:serine/threonine protein kinase
MEFEELATQPEPFPDPVIRASKFRRVNVHVNGKLERKAVIESGSGHFYEIGTTLKKAIFGQVVLALLIVPSPGNTEGNNSENDTFVRTNEERAIKIYSKRTLRALQGRTAENPLVEITALQFIGDNHPNIMGQIECCTDDDNIYSIMRYCPGGELFDFIDNNGPLDSDLARSMFRQLLNGLMHLQGLGIGHRDMSLENMLYDGNNLFVIIDFGMCLRMKKRPDGKGYCGLLKQSICGKRNYISPEVMREDPVFNPMLCDIWAAGVILFIALTGVPPVDTATLNDERYRMICDGRLQEMLNSWGMDVDTQAIDLVQRILRPNPQDRPTISQILQHPWMQGS